MSKARKKQAKKSVKPKRRYRRLKNIKDLSKLDTYYISLHEAYKSARSAGFNSTEAFWLITEPGSTGLPDWISSDKKDTIIPKIDPDDDED